MPFENSSQGVSKSLQSLGCKWCQVTYYSDVSFCSTQWCGDALEMIHSNSQRVIDMVPVFAPAMSFQQFLKFYEQSAKAKKLSQGQTQVVWFYHEDDALCPVKMGWRTTFSVDHIHFQNVKLPGWTTLNKSIYGYRCHNLPGVLISINLIKNFWMQRQIWQPVEE